MSIGNNVCEAGEVWFAKLPGQILLSELEIIDKTKETINVKGLGIYDKPHRYAYKDIEFIELVGKQA